MTEFSSATINNLAKALLKAQAQIGPVTKDSVNPFLRNKYASLAAVLDAVRTPLLSNGIVLVQRVEESEPGSVAIGTMLIHAETGEWLSSTTVIPLADAEAGSKVNLGQQTGAAISYGRRYGLMAMLSMAAIDEDTDNEVRSQPQQHQSRFQPPQRSQQKQEQAVPEPPSRGVVKTSYPGLPDIPNVAYEDAKDPDGKPIVIASGATLQSKESLKRAGFRWSPERRVWWVAA